MSSTALPVSVDAVVDLLERHDYFADRRLATSVFLALKMGRPLFLEGEAGVGKTEIAKVLAAALGRELVRLQCYEGLDTASAVYEDEKLQIYFEDMRVVCDGAEVKLTRKEFALLAALARRPGRVATRQQLLDDVWGQQYYGDTRTLDVHIRRLRQKLGACADSIETVVGVGYRFTGCSAYEGGGATEK